jgi:hypothetical protein
MNNFKSIIDSFSGFSEQHPIIKTFTFGQMSDTGQDEELLDFPLMHVVPLPSTIHDTYTDFNFNIIFASMLDDIQSNNIEIVELCHYLLRDFIEYYINQLQSFNFYMVTPVNFTPFLDRFSIYVAGVEAQITLRVEGTYCL